MLCRKLPPPSKNSNSFIGVIIKFKSVSFFLITKILGFEGMSFQLEGICFQICMPPKVVVLAEKSSLECTAGVE